MRDPNYRPKYVEFDVAQDGTCVPLSLGEFKSADEAMKFMGKHITSINQSLTCARHMDNFEKTEIRKEYNDILENRLPLFEKELSIAASKLAEAKKDVAEKTEMVDAAISQSKILAKDVKRGLVDMKLDDLYTARVPFKGRYYFYTYLDGELRLCAIRDIPEHEKTEIWNAMAANEEFFETNFGEQTSQDEQATA